MYPNAPDESTPGSSPTGPTKEFPVRLRARHGGTMRRISRRHALKRFFLRMDVLWPALFFLFLVCIAVLITSISRTQMPRSATGSWREIHEARKALFDKLLDIELDKAHSIATTLMAANVQTPLEMRSEKTLSVVCSTFVSYDTETRLRAVLVASASSKETVTCIHGATNVGTTTTLTGYISNNSIVKGTYYVDNSTYRFARPLAMATAWPESAWNISLSMSASLLSTEGFRQPMLYYRGLIDHVDPRKLWFYFARMPHMFYYNIPLSLVARGFRVSDSANLNDFAQVRIDGSVLLPIAKYMAGQGARVVIFVNQSLNTSDPLIFSTNYGQRAVSNSSVYSASADTSVTYLKTSQVSDPLMKAALKHVKLSALQKEGYAYTTEFTYEGAPAIVTAYVRTTKRGLILPVVTANAQITVTAPFIRISDVWTAITIALVVLLTALFWWFVHVSFSQPLERMTELMLGNLYTGHRTPFYENGERICTQLSEVKELIDAHDDTVHRLRLIDKFIPTELRGRLGEHARLRNSTLYHGSSMNRSLDNAARTTRTVQPGESAFLDSTVDSNQLLQQTLTVVYITISPQDPSAATRPSSPSHLNDSLEVPSEAATHYRQGQRLAAAVDTAAQAGSMINSGPFPTPASLEHFLGKVEDLCEAYNGAVHRLSPDSCVLHFGAAARAHLLRHVIKPSPASTQVTPALTSTTHTEALEECAAATDAQNAAKFALCLHTWYRRTYILHGAGVLTGPDVRMLLDTSTFTCGHYRPLGGEQTLSVAFGRDVQRKLGYVPAKIGVFVAMTEETASLVRGEPGHCGGAGGFRAVRQIPVESLHIGRPDLNADVVILYEALPGPSDSDEVWLRFRWCCFRAFACMVRGDYVSALSLYREVADIADLEPGLMPASLRREAAHSNVIGGAVSTQVERLMKECERRINADDTRRFCRERCDPLGIDAVLQGMSTLNDASTSSSRRASDASNIDVAPRHKHSTHPAKADGAPTGSPLFTHAYPRAAERYVVDLQTRTGTIRSVVASPPKYVEDNMHLHWRVATAKATCVSTAAWEFYCLGLGSAGALASLDFVALCAVPPPVARAICAAPAGPMSDALRSAVPVFDATRPQRAALRALCRQHRALQHPNLLTPLSYACAMEGGACFVWAYFTGGTLRQVRCRYRTIKPITLARFMYGVLGALAFLHERGIAHGAVHLDNVMVDADGNCRLRANMACQPGSPSQCPEQQLFATTRTCYVSPAMASGHAPTPACDVFCYGLLCIELLSRKSPWKWAPANIGQPERTQEELDVLVAEANQPFLDAVANGHVVANADFVDAVANVDEHMRSGLAVFKDCLSAIPEKRPSALRMFDVTNELLIQAGILVAESTHSLCSL